MSRPTWDRLCGWVQRIRPAWLGWALVVGGFVLGVALAGAGWCVALTIGLQVRRAEVERLQAELAAVRDTACARVVRLPDGRIAWCAPARPDSIGHRPTMQSGIRQ